MSLQIDYPGRFGNNLFQYIFGRLFARRNNLALITKFNHEHIVSMTPHEKGKWGAGKLIKLGEGTTLETKVPLANYQTHGFFQNSDFYWQNRGEIKGFARPVTKVEPRPMGHLVVNLRVGRDYRKVGIHPSWYRNILKTEPYEKLYVVADEFEYDYFKHALAGHKYEVYKGDPKAHFDFLRSFRRMIASNSTFCWWANFFGHSERTFVFKDWIGNPFVHLTQFPGSIEVPGKHMSQELWSWVDPDEGKISPPHYSVASMPEPEVIQSTDEKEVDMKRNLFFYLYPKYSEGWRWHAKRIQDFWPVFNGRKRILISVDDKTEDPELVKSAFSDPSIEFEVVQNHKTLWETDHFLRVLDEMKSLNSDEITFYAHAKGVIHSDDQIRRVWRWCDAMYILNLSSPALTDKLLSKNHALGCFKFPPREWFYAGTFFWFKHSALFSKKDWKRIGPDKYSVERYLALHIESHKAFTMTPFLGGGDLYGNPPQRKVVLQWLREHMTREKVAGFDEINRVQSIP